MSREVTERDFRKDEFKDANVEDYEIRDDGAVVRKDRWEQGIRKIAEILSINYEDIDFVRGEFEIRDVILAVDKLVCSHKELNKDTTINAEDISNFVNGRTYLNEEQEDYLYKDLIKFFVNNSAE
jgi:hypothetical protein